MPISAGERLLPLMQPAVGTRRAERLLGSAVIPDLPSASDSEVSQADLAMALALLLFEGVCDRVPAAEAYVTDIVRDGRRFTLDHGALRTVDAPCGALPSGKAAFDRLLRPLGYRPADVYPLEKLAMTGHSYVHEQLPEKIPQYFVSELHVSRFSSDFQTAVHRVVGDSQDPLTPAASDTLEVLAARGSLAPNRAQLLLPELLACFDRVHDVPSLADYELIAAESEEMAWIVTEGQAFNHATDRVDDVSEVADRQRRLERPIKEKVEVSASGRVLQTAFRAALVERMFVDSEEEIVLRTVPGSFHELITRHRRENGELDLSFDSSNAQGIFVMTRREQG
jgi:hypothetical protein